jgi:hypothetical protein
MLFAVVGLTAGRLGTLDSGTAAYAQMPDQWTPEQWCQHALVLMGDPAIAEQGREALLEMARNRGCLQAPPRTVAVQKSRPENKMSSTCAVLLALASIGPPEDRQMYAADASKNNCGPPR